MNAEKAAQAEFLSQTPNKELMKRAREALKGNWGRSIGTSVVYVLVLVAPSIIPFLGNIIATLINGSLQIGLNRFFLALTGAQESRLSQLFSGFKKFAVALGAYALIGIFVLLWSLLLIIPGIIASLSYSLTFYILVEEDIGPLEAIRKSKKMMRGNKWKLFCLGWRFFGWVLLCILTLGVGFLWLMPYQMASFAEFYRDLKKK